MHMKLNNLIFTPISKPMAAQEKTNPKQKKSFMSFYKFTISKSHHKPKPEPASASNIHYNGDNKTDRIVRLSIGKMFDSLPRKSKDYEEKEELVGGSRGMNGVVEGRRSVNIQYSSDNKNDRIVKLLAGKIVGQGFDLAPRKSKDFTEEKKCGAGSKAMISAVVEGKRSVNAQYKGDNKTHLKLKLPVGVIAPASLASPPRKSKDFEEKEKCGGGSKGTINTVVEGRRSVSQVETNLESVAAFLAVKVMAADMPGFMQAHAFRCARRTFDSLEKFSSKHMAFNIKKEFDKVYGPAWHCIVGSGFGSFVTHSRGCFLYFSIEKLYVLVFRTKVHRAVD